MNPREFIISGVARQDIEALLRTTLDAFGESQLDRYRDLIAQALKDVAADPLGIRSRARPELGPDVRSFHIGRRGHPARHLLLYRVGDRRVVISRVLHDAMDAQRHLSDEE